MLQNFVSQAQLAQILCVSLKTLQNRLCSHPESLPTPIRFPGAKAPVWHPQVIKDWQDSFLTGSIETRTSNNSILVDNKKITIKKKGRPSNAQRAARGEI